MLKSGKSRMILLKGQHCPPSANSSSLFLISSCVVFASQCNTTCGEGMRSRKVGCVGPGMTPVHDDYCEPSSQPPLQQACKGAPCHFRWITGEWSQVGKEEDTKTDVFWWSHKQRKTKQMLKKVEKIL